MNIYLYKLCQQKDNKMVLPYSYLSINNSYTLLRKIKKNEASRHLLQAFWDLILEFLLNLYVDILMVFESSEHKIIHSDTSASPDFL